MTHYENIAPRNPLKVSPVQYPWSSIDQMYYGQIIKDELFYEVVEQSIYDGATLCRSLESLNRYKTQIETLTDSKLPGILGRFSYQDDIDEASKQNVGEWVTLIAKIAKIVAWDSLYFLLKSDPMTIQELPISHHQSVYLELFYERMRPAIEVHSRKAIAFFIDEHSQLGECEGTSYTIDQTSDGTLIIKMFVKCFLKELMVMLMQKDMFAFKDSKVHQIETMIPVIIDIEMGLISRSDDEDDALEGVYARVKHVLSIFGSPKIRNCEHFVKQLTKLAYGEISTNFGLTKRNVVGTGGTTGEKIHGKKIHRASNKEKMLMSSSAGKHLIQKKANENLLTEKKRVSPQFATGGEVFMLLDATGSTMPGCDGYGVINFEESIAATMAQCCRENNRKLTVYFYNEGTVKVESFSPTEPEKTFKLKKLNLFGNAGYRNNDEVTTFAEVFHEISRKPGARHSIIFVSDGGVLSGSGGDRDTQVGQIKSMFSLYSKIEVLPILISPYVDGSFARIFHGYKMIHISEMEDFDGDNLNECIDFVKNQEI